MKTFAPLLIMVSILVSALSIGGMTGGFAHMMHGAMTGSCTEVSCAAGNDGMQVADCVGHCLSTAQSTAAPTAAAFALLLLAAAVLFFFGVREPLAARREPPGAFSSFIGKLLQQQRLSTVVLRN